MVIGCSFTEPEAYEVVQHRKYFVGRKTAMCYDYRK